MSMHIPIERAVPVTHKNPSVVRESGQRLVQRLVHLLAVALEEPAASWPRSEQTPDSSAGGEQTSVKESISRKHSLVLAILHEEADAVLGVAGRVQRLDGDAANVERVAVLRRLGYLFAVLAADYFELAEL
jgi:hypothetical protein